MNTQHLVREEGTIAYDDTGGNGPVVLCAPGMGDLRGLYRHLTPRLRAGGHRVVTMDLRGHGDSSTGWHHHTPEAVGDDMLALIRHLDAGPAVIIGHSFSPAAAIWAAATAGDQVAGLVLSAPFFRQPPMGVVTRTLAALVMRSPWLWTQFYRSLHRTPPEDLATYLRRLRANLRQPGRMAAVRALGEASKEAANARLADVTCPVLVVMGARDPDFAEPETEARTGAAPARDATVAMIAEAGHYPPTEAPADVAGHLLPFLARVRGEHRAG